MTEEISPIRRREWHAMSSRRFAVIGFAVVGVVVLLATLSALVQTRKLQQGARDLVDDVLMSIRLIGELDTEVEKRRILVDDHIFANEHKEMVALEHELQMLDARIATTTQTYDRWAVLPGERDTWNQARADLGALDAPIANALALSRQNRDVEARHMMEQVAAQFTGVDHDLDQLIKINNQGATASLEDFSTIRIRLTLTLLGVALAAILGIVLVGGWAAQMIGRREQALAREASRLEERNRELDAFAGRVAHDIRSPLTAMTLAMAPLATKVPHDDRSFQVLRRGARTMGQLIDDLLTLSRSDADSPGRCDPADVVREMQEDFGARLDAEKGALRASVAHAEVSCSEGLLRQAVTNLIENAVKYRRPEVAPEVGDLGGHERRRLRAARVGQRPGDGARRRRARLRALLSFAAHARRPGDRAGALDRPIASPRRAAARCRSTRSSDTASTFVIYLPLAARAAPPPRFG